jgi:hypothetical protein
MHRVFYKDIVFYWYVSLYFVLALTALNFNYVEGDDASTILYHLMGRNVDIQAPYSPYHSGFDFILSLLPVNETILRVFSICVSYIFGFMSLYLLRVVVLRLIPKDNKLFWFILPFIIPEILFHSLLYNPTNVAFSFTLLSFIQLSNYLKNSKIGSLIFASILFGIGMPFRWSIVMIIFTFLSLIIIKFSEIKSSKKNLISIGLYLSLSAVFTIITLYVTGYTLLDFFNVFIWGKNYNDHAERSLLSLIATGAAFFTPGLFSLLVTGIYFFIKKYGLKMSLSLLLPLIPIIVLGFFPSYKFLIHILPLIIFLAYLAFISIKDIKILKYSILFLVFLPWLAGLQLEVNGISYGPGFCSKICIDQDQLSSNETNLDKRAGIKAIKPSLKGGLLMPTLEGPRPLYGYFSVLFLREWYTEIEKFYLERKHAISIVEKDPEKCILIQDRKTAYLQNDLYRLGYCSNSKFITTDSNIICRKFTNSNGKIIILYAVEDKSKILSSLDSLVENSRMKIIFRSSYSSLVNEVIKNKRYKCLGTYTATSR